MLRVFMSSTHTGAILQAIYANSTAQKGCFDVLLLDYPPMKESLIELIKRSDVIHKWDKVIDFSVSISDDTNKKPSLSKKIVRKVKTLPIIKGFYDKLLMQHLVQQKANHTSRLTLELSSHFNKQVQLNILTKTGLNECLFDLFPNAEINYFEHGIGDYMYYEQQTIKEGNFYCLFNEEFGSYLKISKPKLAEKVFGYIQGNVFSQAITNLLNQGVIKTESITEQEKYVFVLMENVEMYEVESTFWTEYIDVCLKKIPSPEEYTFIIKPHHMQSFEAIEMTTSYLNKKGIKYKVLTNNYFMHMGAEVVFYFFQDKTEYVFSLFSSSIYYFTKLYPSSTIKYFHGYKLFAKYTNNAPKQFVEIYQNLQPIISNVVSKNCLDI